MDEMASLICNNTADTLAKSDEPSQFSFITQTYQ